MSKHAGAVFNTGTDSNSVADAEFIANARQDIPYLLNLVKAAMELESSFDWDDGDLEIDWKLARKALVKFREAKNG